jgi:hypothetical protein
MQKKGGILNTVYNLYHNEYQWSLIKSVGIFILGVRIAKECVGIEIMPAVAPN